MVHVTEGMVHVTEDVVHGGQGGPLVLGVSC